MSNLWICPKGKECDNKKCAITYDHSIPHKKKPTCATNCSHFGGVPCIPYVQDFKVGDRGRVKHAYKYEEGEGEMEYKWLKGISVTINEMYTDVVKTACAEAYKHFGEMLYALDIKRMDDCVLITDLIHWAKLDKERINWLLEKGYIEKVESEMEMWEKEAKRGMTLKQKLEWAKRMPKE